MSKKVPAYLEVDAERVVVKLSKPSEANGVVVDRLVMRAPTVRDVRAAQATANGDDELRELNLFSSLVEAGVKDLEGLTLKDYTRLQAGYFRLVQDDEF
ncbi:phage tail assembly protein [Pseudomonas gingeri]|uniref:Phage tail assembly protein n=1 Tax=Pseudomonas gingeri TaxID=117681 RepID=A0A7Y8CN57_9PSED|nr:phage tail assembly protein [Pseudomonas gingeri]NWA04815.1 phage tail assembly protein [Pseudomonas gingeri]NWA17696.1 phage tail assembly protein [Pseudomonas gingeri]NWA56896.1 phage tail assembly protein [Pseudomonas gingeri]NWA97238.1 phage tail assembly protein [Pseudomonas gingeri]NWB01710.1 phage tail assembly protein [Pseudomonas gingeri]